MRVLVTGGAGFIGSHFVDLVVGLGGQVVVVDDLSSGRADNLPAHPSIEFVKKTFEHVKCRISQEVSMPWFIWPRGHQSPRHGSTRCKRMSQIYR